MFEETGRSFFSKPRSPDSTQNSLLGNIGATRKKKTVLTFQKTHEVDAVLQYIRNLQQSSERVRYEYAMSRFEPAEDGVLPGSRTQNRSIRLETANVANGPDARLSGAGILPTQRILYSGAHALGVDGDGECHEEGEHYVKGSDEKSLQGKRKSQDTLNQEKKAHRRGEEPSLGRTDQLGFPEQIIKIPLV